MANFTTGTVSITPEHRSVAEPESERISPASDPGRLRSLASYGILDTPPEPGFEDIVALAAQFCGTPVALVSLIDADRQWFKARTGFEPCQTSLDQSVCVHALAASGTLIITDLSDDPRTRDNPQVVGPPYLRFYAGSRLDTADGHTLGTLCVIDHKPRPGGLDPGQVGALEALARQVVGQMELRRAIVERDVARRRLHSVFQTSYQLQGFVDLDGILRDANDVSLQAIGLPLDDVVGQPFCQTPWFSGTPGMESVVRRAIAVAADGGVARQEIEIELPGGRRTFDFSIRAVRDACGTVFGFVPEAVDLTERKAFEEQLRQSQKMEAVGQLTGGLAHDFNNLLTGISGSIDMMRKRVAQGRVDDLDRYLLAAQEASRRAAALTHRLLAFSRRQTLDPKPTDVSKLINGMADLIRRTVGPEITVEFVDMVGLWTALVDPNQLENALLNLAINARDAMPDGGRITVETGNRWMDERAAKERDLVPGQYLSICLSDTGTGMPPDIVARAFDPFFTTKPLGLGTGLGLSMIYGFARQSAGQVRIYSEVGQGTMVCMYLPRHYADEQGAIAREREEVRGAEVGESVLVVDDEPTIRMLVTDVLSDLGYGALEAEDGAAGLRILQSNARVDLLVTDVGLPNGMNGRQVADAARALRPGLKVLFITGYAENAAIGDGHLDPGMAVLTKPFAMDDLAMKIRRIIEG